MAGGNGVKKSAEAVEPVEWGSKGRCFFDQRQCDSLAMSRMSPMYDVKTERSKFDLPQKSTMSKVSGDSRVLRLAWYLTSMLPRTGSKLPLNTQDYQSAPAIPPQTLHCD